MPGMASHRSFGGFGARPCIAIGKLGARLVVGRVPDRNALRNDQSSRTPAERNPSVYSLKNRGAPTEEELSSGGSCRVIDFALHQFCHSGACLRVVPKASKRRLG